jgi:hypothetical protein
MPKSDKTAGNPIPEERAIQLLTRWFNQAGYNIANHVRVCFGKVEATLDGWDAAALVGFEYLSDEHNDHADLTLEEYQHLIEAHNNQKYHVLVIDEVEALTQEELKQHAKEFLESLNKLKSPKQDSLRKLRKKVEELEARVQLLEQQQSHEIIPGYQPDRHISLPTLPQRPAVVCERARHSC